jgi:diguanylate cyclase (GGDEF)-like protein/PAS domain S-box-containing protein
VIKQSIYIDLFHNWSIRNKLIFLFVCMALISALAVSIPLGIFDFFTVRRAMTRDMATLADVLANNSTGAIIFHDERAAKDVLQALRAVPSMTSACIYTQDGKPFATYVRQPGAHFIPPRPEGPASRFESGRLVQFRDIKLEGEPIGTIYLESDLMSVNARLREYSLAVACTLLITLLLAYLVAHRLQQPICRPALALVKTAHAISEATDYSIRADITNTDEFGVLASEFNEMLDQIQARDQQLRLRREELERDVASRTNELVIANAQLRQTEEKYRAIFEDAVVGIFQITPEGKPLSINRSLAEMHGFDCPEEMIAEVSDVTTELFVNPRRMAEIKSLLTDSGVVRGAEVEVYRRDRSRKWALVNMREVCSSDGKLELYEGTVEDITERKMAQERIQVLAYYDELTELPNRTLLQDRLAKALAGAARRKEKVALLFLDLDRFKIINDSLGHSVGDLLLQKVAGRLKQWAREQDTIARIGGDEFLVVLNGIRDITDIAVAAERLMDAMTPEFDIEGHSFAVSCSIGISIFPEHGTDNEALIKNADAAMYCAKESGRNAFRFFTEEMNAQVVERMTFERDMRLALERNEFFLMYQPQIELQSGRVVGLEALLRWQHPTLGLVSPDKFIRVAESTGLILPIGEWVMKSACAAARAWREASLPFDTIAINVSALQFRREGFRELVEKTLTQTGLPPENLELELTESVLISNTEVTVPVLQELKAMGVHLALDDFGTGYSSLSYLSQFPVNKVKIDRSFIKAVPANTDDAAITRAIVSMCKSLNLRVLAEGVETEEQVRFLRAQQCDEVQGYYYSKPLRADMAKELLSRYSILPFAASPKSSSKSNPEELAPAW